MTLPPAPNLRALGRVAVEAQRGPRCWLSSGRTGESSAPSSWGEEIGPWWGNPEMQSGVLSDGLQMVEAGEVDEGGRASEDLVPVSQCL